MVITEKGTRKEKNKRCPRCHALYRIKSQEPLCPHRDFDSKPIHLLG